MPGPRGPLPDPTSRRRNVPTIPTTKLPASGRKGRPPQVPKGYDLGPAGKRYWLWAWRTPQAAAWDSAAVYTVARRAQLEDLYAALEEVEGLDVADLLGQPQEDAERQLRWLIRSLKALASNGLAVMKEKRELDGKLGLNPEALSRLRWTIVDDSQAVDDKPRGGESSSSNVRRLRPRDPAAAAG